MVNLNGDNIHSMTTWTSPNKSTVEKYLLTEDNFILLSEDGTYLLQEDDFPDWGNPSKNTSTWSGSNKITTNWSSPVKN